jgi:hypothetical protein
MKKNERRPLVRSLLATAALATSMLIVAPSPAHAACSGHFQPGATLTVAGQPVRIPALEIEVCQSGPTTTLVPAVDVITSSYGSCSTNCYAVVLRQSPSSPYENVTVRVLADGEGVDETKFVYVGGSTSFCVLGAGFPAPPVSGCFISFDPDF